MDTLSNYRNLLREAVDAEYINEEELALLEKWNRDPKKWDQEFNNH